MSFLLTADTNAKLGRRNGLQKKGTKRDSSFEELSERLDAIPGTWMSI
jgi:hypothetical protein